MKTKSTIAIIGNHQNMKPRTIRLLVTSGQRILLFDGGLQFSEWAPTGTNDTEVEIIHCAINASWEADLVLINLPIADLEEVMTKIKPYVTQKTLIALINNEKKEEIQKWLPDTDIHTISDPKELNGVLEDILEDNMAQF